MEQRSLCPDQTRCPACDHKLWLRGGYSWCVVCGHRQWSSVEVRGTRVLQVAMSQADWCNALAAWRAWRRPEAEPR